MKLFSHNTICLFLCIFFLFSIDFLRISDISVDISYVILEQIPVMNYIDLELYFLTKQNFLSTQNVCDQERNNQNVKFFFINRVTETSFGMFISNLYDFANMSI